MKRILFTEFFPEENREKSVANPCQMLPETDDKPPGFSELEWLCTKGLVWIDLDSTEVEDMDFLARGCNFHPLAIEDCINKNQRPKLDEYGSYLFIVLHRFQYDIEKKILRNNEIHIFFNEKFVVTVHQNEEPSIEQLRGRCMTHGNPLSRGTDQILYMLFDHTVDSNFPILDKMSEEIVRIESQILVNQDSQQTIAGILFLKRNLTRIRRILSPQREIVNSLIRRDNSFLSPKIQIYFRDVYDHLSRIYETIDMDRDLLGNTMDAYFSVISQRTNDIVKRLTLINLIFMPLTFLTGFFGMNFTTIPYENAPLLYVTIGLMYLIPIGMIFWFRKKHWFKTPNA
ncbi:MULTISPECIES: magnesium/cobalt transporter CorA [Leptospira]|uniref:Magnesium transport protein CorA n=4 Tax=Leptospira santarosai TaxID=28183 RepID=A0AB73LKP8_9LEPT|nr:MULTISPECIES: magnesium/cobalt transporter CorA [Leptospira]ASV11461.1 magnesium and cobalt transport protein CorA [Leptospira santarosai]AVV49545.1 Magnesium transport protein CorA [Leptospira santarosai]AVV80064.1 Magnesium transport protein CorA [Leptospira santarosai]EKO76476.1 magnesium and cobalt transport protein CorA [Leptospira sp. Fiocruz LV3954]EKS09626.1 magnesium and cobalt transport protein CorA [Leptospira santarosai str. JET]